MSETRPPTRMPSAGYPPNTPRLSSRMEREKRKAERGQYRKLPRPGFREWMNSMISPDIRLIAREISSRVGVWIIVTHPCEEVCTQPRLNQDCFECVSASHSPQESPSRWLLVSPQPMPGTQVDFAGHLIGVTPMPRP